MIRTTEQMLMDEEDQEFGISGTSILKSLIAMMIFVLCLRMIRIKLKNLFQRRLEKRPGISIVFEMAWRANVETMERQLLICQYPVLRNFINESFDSGEPEKVFDLLFALETQDQPTNH